MGTYKFDYCVTTNTPQCYPYVDLIRPTFGVAIGGCGQAAKCSDEIGNMAARYVNISDLLPQCMIIILLHTRYVTLV